VRDIDRYCYEDAIELYYLLLHVYEQAKIDIDRREKQNLRRDEGQDAPTANGAQKQHLFHTGHKNEL